MQNLLRVVIAEDNSRDIKILNDILEKYCEDVEVVGIANTVKDTIKIIRETRPKLLFLDVEMPPHNGFDVLEAFPEIDFDVVFTTGHEEYAIKAIKFSALDYLLKPLNIEEVQSAVNKTRRRKKGQVKELTTILKGFLKEKEPNFTKIVIPSNDNYVVINLKDIIYCEAVDSYTKIHTQEKTYLASRPLKKYEEMFSDKDFYRVHRSFLVNINHIAKIIKGIGAAVIMSDKTNIPISMRKKDEFFRSLESTIRL